MSCVRQHTTWSINPAEVGVPNTVALLPCCTRLGVQVARKLSPWGRFGENWNFLLLIHYQWNVSCIIGNSVVFGNLGYGFCHSQSTKYLHTNFRNVQQRIHVSRADYFTTVLWKSRCLFALQRSPKTAQPLLKIIATLPYIIRRLYGLSLFSFNIWFKIEAVVLFAYSMWAYLYPNDFHSDIRQRPSCPRLGAHMWTTWIS